MTPNQITSLFPCLFLLTPVCGQDPITLQPPTTGKVAFVQRSKQEQNIDAGGQQMEAAQELTQHYTIEATKVGEDGKRTFTVVLQRVHGKIDIPMAGGVDFDSDAKDGAAQEEDDGGMGGMGLPSASTVNAALKELIGKSFTAEVGADGVIHGTAGFEEPRKAAEKKLGPAAGMLASAMSDRSLHNLVRAAIGHLPAKPAKLGDTWETKVEAGNAFPMEQSLKLKLDSADGDAAKVSYTGTIALKEGASRGANGEATVENGKCEGAILLSRKDGFTQSLKSTSSMTLLTESPMGEVSIEMKQTTEVLRADAAKAETKPTETKTEEPKKVEAGK